MGLSPGRTLGHAFENAPLEATFRISPLCLSDSTPISSTGFISFNVQCLCLGLGRYLVLFFSASVERRARPPVCMALLVCVVALTLAGTASVRGGAESKLALAPLGL